MTRVVLFLSTILFLELSCVESGLGPVQSESRGFIWPKPRAQTFSRSFFSLAKSSFKFKLDQKAKSCEILKKAPSRFLERAFPKLIRLNPTPRDEVFNGDPYYIGELNVVDIELKFGKCEDYPSMNMDEGYELKIHTDDAPGKASIVSTSVWGILRGLESFTHLVYVDEITGNFIINRTYVRDFPRFSFRGILIDSSRHFLTKEVIKDNLDLMEMNKFNVLHWHIVDDPSFPYISSLFPKLSAIGAYDSKTHVYSSSDIKEIIDYARFRGIRVLPEFDTPGHTQSWGPGQPDLLTPCYSGSQPNGYYGPINPILNTTYLFLDQFFGEVSNVFKDEYVHLGGDEVSFDCWKSNPAIKAFMKRHKFISYAQLESYYIERLLKIVESKKKQYIVWNEVFDNKNNVTKDTVIHIWVGNAKDKLNKVTKAGLRAILSEGWYLNAITYGPDWTQRYMIDPHNFTGTPEQKKLVIGGEACMWGEYVNTNNLIPRLWPRASAVAERLWSAKDVRDTTEAAPRIQGQQCRLMRRGYPVEPIIGPGFCKYSWS